MIIKREQYIEALLNKRWNGKVKIITGIRRCGKSFLLSTLYNLYKDYLKSEGVSDDCFILFLQKSLAIPNKSSTFAPREPAKPLHNA